MDAAIKEQWINDLLSGEFEQGKNALEREGTFCCLGVLCYRAAQAGVLKRDTVSSWPYVRYGDDQSILPYEVAKWAGLGEQPDGDALRGHYVDGDGVDGWLTVDNDASEQNFAEIAETIRKFF